MNVSSFYCTAPSQVPLPRVLRTVPRLRTCPWLSLFLEWAKREATHELVQHFSLWNDHHHDQSEIDCRIAESADSGESCGEWRRDARRATTLRPSGWSDAYCGGRVRPGHPRRACRLGDTRGFQGKDAVLGGAFRTWSRSIVLYTTDRPCDS